MRHVEETGSTNADLVELADTAEVGSVLVAGHQTAGRGRLDRRWDAPPGANLLMSVLLRPTGGPDRRSLITSTLAVAVVDALTDLFDLQGPTVGIKWPNDVLIGGLKVGGILCEGGPHLSRDMVFQGCVDEVAATTVPRLVAGAYPRTTEGAPVDIALTLTMLLEDEGTLFGRWALGR